MAAVSKNEVATQLSATASIAKSFPIEGKAILTEDPMKGTKNAATDIIPNKMHEVCKFVSLDEHANLFGFYWMSDEWLKSLPENYQNLVVEGVRQMAEIQSNWNKQYENQALMEFQESGGTVYVPSPDEKATFLKGAGVRL